MVDSKTSVINKLKQHFSFDGTPVVNDDLRVDAPDDVVLHNQFHTAFEKLPVKFSHVGGGLMLSINMLKTLEGCPSVVEGSFECDRNQLESLELGPTKIGGGYNCSFNQLKNLVGAPLEVPLVFNCAANPLNSLEGLPQKMNLLYITYDPHLPLLRALVAPDIIFWPYPNEDSDAVKVLAILKKYSGKGKRGLFDCQKELEDAGFEDNARW